jgi:hypothetical protein
MQIKSEVRWCSLLVACLAGAAVGTVAGCNDTPTTAQVENTFASDVDGASARTMTVYKAWWVTTLFPNPVAAQATSESERTIPASDFAYALLAPGWSPADGSRPPRLIAAKSAAQLSVAVHDRLHIEVSDDTFVGDCAAGKPLDADDARLIVERIFSGDFAGVVYDPATCTNGSQMSDAGTSPDALDAGSDLIAPDSSMD